jgi:hypothetical protein
MNDMNGTLEEVLKALPKGEEVLKADGLDDAVVGFEDGVLVYSKEKCTKALMDRDGMDEDEAIEFLYFNTYSAYMGVKTPIFRYDCIEDLLG